MRRQADEYYDRDSREHRRYWHDFAECHLFGIEISEGIARTAKMNMVIHDDGHTNVIAFDGLEPIAKMPPKTNKKGGFRAGYFDYIVTNPPFGAKIKFAEKRYIENYVLGCKDVDWIDAKLNNVNLLQRHPREQQTTEVLFLEQCHRFLKPGGTLAMVIPDSILTNSSMQYVRDWIEEHWRIVAVVSLPQFAFAANGAGVKSSVLFLRKYDEATTAALQAIKAQARDSLFAGKNGGGALEKLIEEKKAVLKRSDATIQGIEDGLVAKLDALAAQYRPASSDTAPRRKEKTAALREAAKDLKAEAKAAIEAHKDTEASKPGTRRLRTTITSGLPVSRKPCRTIIWRRSRPGWTITKSSWQSPRISATTRPDGPRRTTNWTPWRGNWRGSSSILIGRTGSLLPDPRLG